MLFFRHAVASASGIALLFFIGERLLSTFEHQGVSSTLAAVFDDQFDCLEQLNLSPTRSVPHIKSLRIHSVAFEDLSCALATSLGEDLPRDVRVLSLDIDAFGALLQSLYAEVDALVHLTATTSYIFGKLLERQSIDRLSRHICRTSRLRTSVRCQTFSQLSLALRRHIDTLSETLGSFNSLAIDVLLARQRLQDRVGAVVSTVIRATDLPMAEDCDLFSALWNLYDRDGDGFSGSVRNIVAFRTFCAQLAHLSSQLDQDMTSVRVLQDVLAAFLSLAREADFYPDIQPSFSTTLIERAETILRFRVAEGLERRGYSHGRRAIEAR